MAASFTTALEMVLFKLGPGFEVIGSDEQKIIDGTIDWLRRHARPMPTSPPLDQLRAVSSALWILDRLLPAGAAEVFEDYKDFGVGHYAWGRRSAERLLSQSPDEFDNNASTTIAAWIDTRSTDEELLRWYDTCRKHGWKPSCVWHEPLAIEEYTKRNPDRQALLCLLENATEQAARIVMRYFLRQLERLPEPGASPPVDLALALREVGDSELSSAFERLRQKRFGTRLELALTPYFWIQQHGPAHLQQLVRAEGTCPYAAITRIAAVAPPDALSTWNDVLHYEQRGTVPIYLFAKWLDPSRRDLLIPEFLGIETDLPLDRLWWGATALQAWVHMAPPDVVAWWARLPDLTHWQRLIFDRFLHAPAACRPPKLMADVQMVDSDFRLRDPLNVIGC